MNFLVKLFFFIYFLLFACKLFKIHTMLYDFILPPTYKEQTGINQIITDEALMDTACLIELYGYPAENHTVITDDGYLITLHRIPRGKKNKTGNGIPVYLQHGAFTSSASWVINEEKSWGFLLADEGYDVWMGNFRDNSYTRKLNNQVDDDDESMGWDIVSDYEIPAIVNYIINETGFDQILAIGHSLGTTVIFGSLITHPELNNKIKGFVALAPTTNVKYANSIVIKIFYSIVLYEQFPIILKTIYNKNNFLHENKIDLLLRLCPATGDSFICNQLIYYLTGYNPYAINKTRIPIYLLHLSNTFPDKFLIHSFQLAKITHEMRGFDYGKEGNMARYMQTTPITYDLSKIKIPVAVMYAVNDVLADPFAVEIICRQLPNLVYKNQLSGQLTTHAEFIVGKTKEAFDNILPILSSMWN